MSKDTEMTKKINYSVILDGTVVDTRKSHRDYTHAVVTQNLVTRNYLPYSVRYCGRLDLAEKTKRDILRPFMRIGRKKVARDTSNTIVTIVPVTLNRKEAP